MLEAAVEEAAFAADAVATGGQSCRLGALQIVVLVEAVVLQAALVSTVAAVAAATAAAFVEEASEVA